MPGTTKRDKRQGGGKYGKLQITNLAATPTYSYNNSSHGAQTHHRNSHVNVNVMYETPLRENNGFKRQGFPSHPSLITLDHHTVFSYIAISSRACICVLCVMAYLYIYVYVVWWFGLCRWWVQGHASADTYRKV